MRLDIQGNMTPDLQISTSITRIVIWRDGTGAGVDAENGDIAERIGTADETNLIEGSRGGKTGIRRQGIRDVPRPVNQNDETTMTNGIERTNIRGGRSDVYPRARRRTEITRDLGVVPTEGTLNAVSETPVPL